MQNLSGLAGLDFTGFAGKNNLQNLVNATSHLKRAHTEFEKAKDIPQPQNN